jgi:hypothetical protein
LTNVNARFILTELFDLVSGIGRPLSRLGASSEPCQEGSKASLHRVRPVPHFYSRSVTSLVFKNIFASRAPIYDVTGMDTALLPFVLFFFNWHELEQAQLYWEYFVLNSMDRASFLRTASFEKQRVIANIEMLLSL